MKYFHLMNNFGILSFEHGASYALGTTSFNTKDTWDFFGTECDVLSIVSSFPISLTGDQPSVLLTELVT